MEPDELTAEETDDLVAWGDRMDGNYQPPILSEPKGGPVPEADPTIDEIHAMAGEPDDVGRAAGHDITPGHDELHHYWTAGPGRALWEASLTPWRTLYALVTAAVRKNGRAVSPEQIKRWVSRWFIEVKHYAAGSDLNRVEHGKPPRGHRVGPG